MQKVPDHAAVNETVKLTRVDSRTEHFSVIVNAVMRSLINNKKTITLPDPQRDLLSDSRGVSHPRWMIERWLKKVGLSKTKKLLSFNNERPEIFLRRKLRDISLSSLNLMYVRFRNLPPVS